MDLCYADTWTPPAMDALLSHCVRADGEQIDPGLSPSPSVLCEDGRGVVYALGADGTIRASQARHINAAVRGTVDSSDAPNLTPNGGGSITRRAVEHFRPQPRVDFEPRTLCVSPSGRFAAIGGLRHASTIEGHNNGVPPSSALAVVSLRSPSRDEDDSGDESYDPDDPQCAKVDVFVDEFGLHHSMRVLRHQWHPNSDSHLILLLSDGTLRVFDASINLTTHEQAYRLDPWGRGDGDRKSVYPLRPEIVDFSFAPAHGWGALSLILLGREGDIYTLCPFAPNGARFPRATLEALQVTDEKSQRWLNKTFPGLSRGGEGASDSKYYNSAYGNAPSRIGLDDSSDEDGEYDSDDDGRGGANAGTWEDDESNGWSGGATLAARVRSGDDVYSSTHFASTPGLRGPLPLGTDPVECVAGERDDSYLGRGVVARCLAVAPFVAGEGGGALLAVAHQRSENAGESDEQSVSSSVAATLDVLILPQEPSPGWAHRTARLDNNIITHTPLVDDDDYGALPPLLAIDRVQLVGDGNLKRSQNGHQTKASKSQNELAPFVCCTFDPGLRERVFCAAGGAIYAVTLTWLSKVEGAVDDDDEVDESNNFSNSGSDSSKRLPLPTVVTLLDSDKTLLGVAPVGDPLAEGLVRAIDTSGQAVGLHPAPPLPPDAEDDDVESYEQLVSSSVAAAEASAELNSLAEGPGGDTRVVPTESGSDLKPGTVEGNAALARAASELKERHLRFAHRVHAATRRHGVRLGVEVKRQRVEAEVLRDGLHFVLARREALARRLERAKAAHTEVRERLRKLAALERSLPRPATAAESAFRTLLTAAQDDAPLLRAKLDELKRRADTLSKESAPSNTGSIAEGSGNNPEDLDSIVREELKSQEFAIRRNAERARALET